MNNVGTAYVLWLGCLLQLHGLHRLYNGKIFTGLLWMFSFGLFGVGQLVDLLLIPNMVQEHNDKIRERFAISPSGVPLIKPEVQAVFLREHDAERVPNSQLMVQLLKAAEARNGKLTVAQGVIDTGTGFDEVEIAIQKMIQAGYVQPSNDPTRGVIIPEFNRGGSQLVVQLLKAAVARDGRISVTQGVLDTGAGFAEVEATLKDMVRTGYVDIGNDPESGVVVYEFKEL